jgi:hypothetical protein
MGHGPWPMAPGPGTAPWVHGPWTHLPCLGSHYQSTFIHIVVNTSLLKTRFAVWCVYVWDMHTCTRSFFVVERVEPVLATRSVDFRNSLAEAALVGITAVRATLLPTPLRPVVSWSANVPTETGRSGLGRLCGGIAPAVVLARLHTKMHAPLTCRQGINSTIYNMHASAVVTAAFHAHFK